MADEREKKQLPIAGQMAANADPSKRDAFMKGAFGTSDTPTRGSLEAMKRRLAADPSRK